MDRAGRRSTSAQAADYLFGLVAGRRMAGSSSIPPLRPGWCRCGCTTCAPARRARCQAPMARALPFWSPDGIADRFLRRRTICARSISPAAQVADLADAPSRTRRRVERRGRSGVRAVGRRRADAARRRRHRSAPLTTLDAAQRRNVARWPSFLPDGRHVDLLRHASQPSRAGIWIASLDDPSARRTAASHRRRARRSSSDHTLLYLRDLALMAQPLDPADFEPIGTIDAGRTAMPARPARAGLRDRIALTC